MPSFILTKEEAEQAFVIAPIRLPIVPVEDLARLKAETLAYVNVARTAFGLDALNELPRGYISHGDDCVIARALSGIAYSVRPDAVIVCERRDVLKLAQVWARPAHPYAEVYGFIETPPAVARFIAAFDHGQYPELVA